MKIFISTDMEGVAGISSWNEMEPAVRGTECYGQLQKELKWIVDELLTSPDGNTIEEITICDSHARGEGLAYGFLDDPRVTHIKGYPRPFYMLQGLDSSYDLLLLVGYHASIGTWKGMMDHSYSASAIQEIRINGRAVGEVEINAYLAGLYGVPLGFVSGDDALEKEIQDFFDINIPFARTKEGIARYAGKMYAPSLVEDTLRKTVRAMLSRGDTLVPHLPPKGDISLQIKFPTTVIADAVATIPGYIRKDGRTAEYVTDDYRNIFRMILATAMLGGRFSQYT